MVRRGWKAVETPSGWYVVRGPRPPSHQWPLATSTQWRPRQPQVRSRFSPHRSWNSGPKSQPGRGVPTKEGGNGIKLNPDEVRGSPVESSAIGGSFSCIRRRKFPREGGDRGFFDPSKDSSSGPTCGGAVEVVRGVFGAIVEEIGRGAGRSGTHKSKVGQIERGSGICTPSGCCARPPSGGHSFASGARRGKRRGTRGTSTRPSKGLRAPKGRRNDGAYSSAANNTIFRNFSSLEVLAMRCSS